MEKFVYVLWNGSILFVLIVQLSSSVDVQCLILLMVSRKLIYEIQNCGWFGRVRTKLATIHNFIVPVVRNHFMNVITGIW